MTEDIVQNSIFETLFDKWRRRKWLIVICFFSVFGAITSLVLALPPLYKSSTTILFGQDSIVESYIRETVPNELELRLGIVRQAVMSRAQLQDVIDSFALYPELRTRASPESVINRFRKDIDIQQRASTQPQWGQNSNFIITISYQGWDPELTARVANDLAARYEAETERIRTSQATRTTEFILEQLTAAKTEFEIQESRINDFKNAHMGELPEQQQINLATLERLNSELRLNGEKQIQLLNYRDDLIFGTGTGSQSEGAIGLTGTLRLDRLKRDLTDLQLRYTENYPGVIRLKKEISDLELELASEPDLINSGNLQQTSLQQQRRDPVQIDMELNNLKQGEAILRENILELVTRIEDTPRIDQQLRRFANDYETTREEYLSLQKSLQEARLAESLEIQQNQQVKILEMAIPIDFPVAPNKLRLIVMGLMAAIGIAGAAVLLTEQMDKSFHSISDIRRFTRVPVLANISEIHSAGEKWMITMRSILGLILVIAFVVALSWFSYLFGESGQQLVWAISG